MKKLTRDRVVPIISASPKGTPKPVSVKYRTGLRHAEMEIGKWRSETGARNPPLKDRNAINRRSETGVRQRRGNVADSHAPRNNTPETRLPGCPERIRTLESRDAAGPWQRLDRKQWGDWRLIFIAERSGLQRRLERHCRRAEIWAGGSIRDLAPLAMVPLRGFGGGGAWCRCNRKGSSNVAQQNPQKDQVCARQEPRETACEAWENDPQRDQAGGRPRPAQTAQGDNDRHYYEGDGLAAALGSRLLCGCGAQEARLDTDIGEGRGRTRLSCACRPAVQIEAEDRRTGGRLAMASMDTRAIEGEIDRIRSLGLEKLRREWRRLNHGEPPRISRDLLILALGYRLQEIAHGGLGKATRRKLQTMAKALRTTGRVGPTPSLSLKPGARLVREWGGRTHTVTVTEDGFEYAGTSYPSLTKIAKKITGAHWLGY